MRKVIIIANCHSISLARAFSLGARHVEASFIDLNFLGRDNENQLIKFLYGDHPGDTLVFSFVTSARFSPVATADLEPILGPKLKTFTNIRFDGLHPDMTMIGPMEGRRHSLIGTYHSKIILFSYLKGMSVRDCLRMFDFDVYERIGYFNEFKNSSERLIARDRECDVKFAGQFIQMIREEPSLYTFNHPTGNVLQMLTASMCSSAEIKFITFDKSYTINDLSNSYIWPIYNEIAEYHKLAYRTPQYFIDMQSFKTRSFSFNEMVRGCYDVYSRQNADELRHYATEAGFLEQFTEVFG